MSDLTIDHSFIRALTKRLKARFAPRAKHTEVLEEIAAALGFKADALMHMLKNRRPEEGLPAPEILSAQVRLRTGTPAVPVGQSVHADGIVCLIDGVKRRMLHRYLLATYGLSSQEYRRIFDLPDDYPMVCPEHAEDKRVAHAVQRLGRASRRQDQGYHPDIDYAERIRAAIEELGDRKPTVEASVLDRHLVCMIDGKRVTSLRAHVRSRYGLREASYRKMFALPDDYPMDASEIAVWRRHNS